MVWDGFLTGFFLGVYARMGRREKRLSDFLWRTYQGRAEMIGLAMKGISLVGRGQPPHLRNLGSILPPVILGSAVRSFFEKACREAVAQNIDCVIGASLK